MPIDRSSSGHVACRLPAAWLAVVGLAAAGCGGSSATPAQDGAPDTSGPVCGNGVLEENEDCDDGNLLSGDGCQNDCTFACIIGEYGDVRCNDKNPGNGAESCGDRRAPARHHVRRVGPGGRHVARHHDDRPAARLVVPGRSNHRRRE